MPDVESVGSMRRVDAHSPEPLLPLDAVIITQELSRRTLRDRDLAAEHRAVTELMEDMASAAGGTNSDRVLRRLVETTCCLCHADSAGISMLEMDGDTDVFRWRAIAGRWAHLTGGTIECGRSSCGVVVQRNAPVLVAHPHRHYGLPPGHEPIYEMLIIPFHSSRISGASRRSPIG
jgi:cytochrome c5